jgi:hypothetical protein
MQCAEKTNTLGYIMYIYREMIKIRKMKMKKEETERK